MSFSLVLLTMKFLFDFLPIVFFFIAYKFFASLPPALISSVNSLPYVSLSQAEPRDAIIFATLILILASILQNLLHWISYRRLEKMHLISLALLLAFGSLTIISKDPNFIKWKVTIINIVFAVALFISLFIGQKTLIERMMSKTISLPKTIWRNVTIMWIIFFIFIAISNYIVAFHFPGENDQTWVNFKLFGLFGLTIVFMIIQGIYLSQHAKELTEN